LGIRAANRKDFFYLFKVCWFLYTAHCNDSSFVCFFYVISFYTLVQKKNN